MTIEIDIPTGIKKYRVERIVIGQTIKACKIAKGNKLNELSVNHQVRIIKALMGLNRADVRIMRDYLTQDERSELINRLITFSNPHALLSGIKKAKGIA
jgi:hypothetical protein